LNNISIKQYIIRQSPALSATSLYSSSVMLVVQTLFQHLSDTLLVD